MRKPVTVCTLVLCLCLGLGHSVWARGKIVISHDEWPLSRTGFDRAPNAATFARNIAAWFLEGTGRASGKFLVFSTNFGLSDVSPDPLTGRPSPLCPTLEAAGHECTVDPFFPFDPTRLQEFDGVFLAGKGAVPDNTALSQYVEQGGNVYLAGGTGFPPGEFRDAREEADAWNPFLNHFGLAFEGADYNGVAGTLPINSAHPIFVGVSALYQENGSDIIDLDPTDVCQVLVSSDSHGLYAVCEALLPTSGSEPLFEPAQWNFDGASADLATAQDLNNCYNYACNRRTDTYAQPGRASGMQYTTVTCMDVTSAALADGLRAIDCDRACPMGSYKKALVVGEIAPGFSDYHWYRQDRDGTWSHKPGGTKATNVDAGVHRILDPRTADRNGYRTFCGCFCCSPQVVKR
jgi:hypothetical protein